LFPYGDTRQPEKHKAQPPIPEPSTVDFETATEKLTRSPPNMDRIPAQLTEAESGAYLLILLKIRNNYLNCGRSQSRYLFIRKVTKQTEVTIKEFHCYLLYTKFCSADFC
jgi:hypothetical protein